MILVYITYTVVIFSNYLFLIILIIVNLLIFFELRKLMTKKIKLKKTFANALEPKDETTDAPSTLITTITKFAKAKVEPAATAKKKASTQHSTLSNEEETQRKTLIMTLWISVVFCSHRVAYGVANAILVLYEGTALNDYASAFFYFYGSLVYSSYLLVYYMTNKIFKKKFNEIVLRQKTR